MIPGALGGKVVFARNGSSRCGGEMRTLRGGYSAWVFMLVLAVCSMAIGTREVVGDTTACQVQDFWIVNGQMGDPNRGNPPSPTGRCVTEVQVAAGDMLYICAKGQIELQASRQNGPAGDFANPTAGPSYWLPGVPEGVLLGCIDTGQGCQAPFVIGRCFAGPAPATGTLKLGINDEFYFDNTGSFKVKGLNAVTGVGNIDPATVPSVYGIAGMSDAIGWTFGLSLAGSGVPAGTMTAAVPGGVVPIGAGPAAFVPEFVNRINGNPPFPGITGPDPDCICALPTGPGFDVIAGRNGPPAYDLWITAPAACNTAAPPPAGPPANVNGCTFNPTITLLSGATSIPTLGEWGLILLVVLLLGTGAFLAARRRAQTAGE